MARSGAFDHLIKNGIQLVWNRQIRVKGGGFNRSFLDFGVARRWVVVGLFGGCVGLGEHIPIGLDLMPQDLVGINVKWRSG